MYVPFLYIFVSFIIHDLSHIFIYVYFRIIFSQTFTFVYFLLQNAKNVVKRNFRAFQKIHKLYKGGDFEYTHLNIFRFYRFRYYSNMLIYNMT